MRAICESCSQPQPRDWQPGDLCIHCGLAVRQEVRCFWCAKWTPFGKFCRKCGADVLEDPSMFGAARMLKDAGADRFTIPKMLREFDPERVEMFRAMYQTQAAIVAAHVADLEYVETFLHQRVWSSELEDQLIAQLPWPEGQGLKVIGYQDENRLRQIATLTPIGITATLGAIALHLHGDFTLKDRLLQALQDKDPRIAEEAALALTHWHAYLESGFPREYTVLIEHLLLQSCFKQQASVRLTSLDAEKYPPGLDALGSPDEDVRFAAALNSCHVDTLRAVARNPDAPQSKSHAATWHLIRTNQLDTEVARSIADLDDRHIMSVLNALVHKKQPFPLLTAELLSLMRKKPSATIRSRAATVLSRSITMETALEMFNIDPKNDETVRILFQTGLPPEAFAAIGAGLLREGMFKATMYGMDNAAKAGHMPESFVPEHYETAGTQRSELIRFAEKQLENRACQPLEDFLIRKCFEEEGKALHDAWSSMSRIVRSVDHAAVCPMRFEFQAVQRIFGSMEAFLPLMTHFLRQTAWHDDVIIWDPLSRFLRYPDDDVWTSVCEVGSVQEYLAALIDLIECKSLRGHLQDDAFQPLIGLAAASPKLRPQIESELRRLGGDDRFEYKVGTCLRRIEQLTAPPADTQ